jgi:hypothetical protein
VRRGALFVRNGRKILSIFATIGVVGGEPVR